MVRELTPLGLRGFKVEVRDQVGGAALLLELLLGASSGDNLYLAEPATPPRKCLWRVFAGGAASNSPPCDHVYQHLT